MLKAFGVSINLKVRTYIGFPGHKLHIVHLDRGWK